MKEVSEGAVFQASFTVQDKDMKAFAELSGDYNAVHVDDAYAISYGLKGRVVYGGLIVASVSKVVGMELPGPGWIWQSVSIQFKKPLYIGKTAQTSATVSYANKDLGVYRLKFKVSFENAVVAEGEAQVGKLTPKAVK